MSTGSDHLFSSSGNGANDEAEPSYISIPQYDEPPVSIKDFGREVFADTPKKIKEYLLSLFPIIRWIYRYNFVWLYGDLIAGITVGAVLVPQSMSYAKIATLPPQIGLYSSFVGVMIYCFFATSKDVSIGPVAVMSLQTSKAIAHVIHKHPEYANDPTYIALGLSLLCGAIALGIGLLRLGFILEYIPMPAVLGFMTGSAFTIAAGQVPGLMGISKLFNTRDATHLVVIHTLQNLKHSNLDAAFGLVSLFILYFSRWLFAFLGKRYPKYERVFFFGSVLRNAFVIIFSTLISWGICHHHKNPKKFPISVLGTVPRGLQNVGYHTIDQNLASALAPELPISTVILLMEHIAIAKSFGRVNDYRINPNQELIAIGTTNMIGTFFNAYPATGSFSRSALKSKCGVRTPLAGIFTGIVVIVAIYGLTGTFYWISNASLSAVIIHAVTDLMAPWYVTWKFWKSSPVETIVFLGAVFLSVFVSLESGIYFSFAACLVFLLLRISFPTGQFLGRVEVVEYLNPNYSEANGAIEETSRIDNDPEDKKKYEVVRQTSSSGSANPKPTTVKKYTWVPLNHHNINKDVLIQPPPPGVFVFRPGESFTFPNAARQLEILVQEVRKQTRKGGVQQHQLTLGERPWNDHGPRHKVYDEGFVDERPLLRAVVFDFSASPHIDLNGVQALADIRQELNKYANREVEYHFVGILSVWSRRALMAHSFGGDNSETRPERHYVEISLRQAAGVDGSATEAVEEESKKKNKYRDEEERDTVSQLSNDGSYIPIIATNTPFFHLEIPNLEFPESRE
ncbi:Sul1p [Sugiyamaella lignohabitans]|uniref:Sul1p n=1 Tax=Sugiyamaella lignohabitans TaxID=796027 RepID=A0A167ETP7_9ASCO|nr:Sul1p [Sugiyamaella lignohabitans]ANB14441.1 Sul1p [Sugiyamaella lignohabitans]